MDWKHIIIEQKGAVVWAYLNRPQKANALNEELWFELESLALWVDSTPEIRVLVLASRGNYFCSGIDFGMIQNLSSIFHSLPKGNRQEWLYQKIRKLQHAFSAFERCSKPVLTAIQGACIGGGIDLITACDMRYATSQSTFCVKEIDLAIVADVGTIQRLPSLVGEGIARELSYTARTVEAQEAKEIGLINAIQPTTEELYQYVETIAQSIASKSPLAIRNTKRVFVHSRDHRTEEGLDYVARVNAGILFSQDAQEAMTAMMQKRAPKYLDT